MILADVRRNLTRKDAELAARLLARDSAAELRRLEARLADEGIDAILDDPRLPEVVLADRRGALLSLPLFTYALVRDSLRRAGEGDRALADYVTAVVVHFAVGDRSMRISPADDEIYDALYRLVADLDDADARRSLLVRAHLGNYALWLSGLFPDRIEALRWRKGGPDLDYYESLGRRGFELAADHRLATEHGLSPLFARAAERFAVIRSALNAVSDRLLFPNVQTPERLMRQVRDTMQFRLAC